MSPFIRTGLLSALLFGMAFVGARWQQSAVSSRQSVAIQAQERDAQKKIAGDRTPVAGANAVPQWHDALLQQALDGRDLISAVREIMAKQQDDHCADTRIFAMVESLPASRLGELSGLLEAFHADPYVHKFVLRAWAQRDVTGALNYIETHPEQRAKHLPDLMEGWTQRDPQAALAWLDGKHPANETNALRSAVVGTIATTDPAQALELLQSKGWLAQSPQLLTKIMHSYGALQPTEALAAMRSVLLQIQGGKTDGIGSAQNFQCLYRALLNGMWERDPASAEAVAEQLTPEECAMGKECYQEEIVTRMPGGIERLLQRPMDQETRDALISSRGSDLMKLFSSLPDDEMRKEVLNRNYDRIGALLPEVMNFIDQRPAGERDEMLNNLANHLVNENAQEAIPIWKRLSPERQATAGPLVFKKYAEESPELAMGELKKCPESLQEQCLRGVCAGMVRNQPKAALDLAMLQTDPALQATCLAAVFGFWGDHEGNTAIKALEENASRIDLKAVLAALPNSASFGNTSYGIRTTDMQNKIRELLHLPPMTLDVNTEGIEIEE